MKKLSKIAQVTFFAAAFAVLFSGTADAYIDPSVMNNAIQAVARCSHRCRRCSRNLLEKSQEEDRQESGNR